MTYASLDADDTSPTLDASEPLAEAIALAHRTVRSRDHAGRTRQGSARTRNQDRWQQRDGSTFVVADGMGGHRDGHLAAATAIEAVLTAVDLPWRERVERANEAVRAQATPGPRRAGTTLVAVDIVDHRATVVSVGDSRVYRLRDGQLQALTEDHTVRGELLTAGIDADLHTTTREAGGLTSFVGVDPERLRVDVIDVPLAAGDRFLLCSDGVHGPLPPHQLAEAVTTGSCVGAIEQLFDLLDGIDARDDATAVVVQIDGEASA